MQDSSIPPEKASPARPAQRLQPLHVVRLSVWRSDDLACVLSHCSMPLAGPRITTSSHYTARSGMKPSACVSHAAGNAVDRHQQSIAQRSVFGLFPQLPQHLHLHPCQASAHAYARCAKQMTHTL